MTNHTCQGCGCDRNDSKLKPFGWHIDDAGDYHEGILLCETCYFGAFPAADSLTYEEN